MEEVESKTKQHSYDVFEKFVSVSRNTHTHLCAVSDVKNREDVLFACEQYYYYYYYYHHHHHLYAGYLQLYT